MAQAVLILLLLIFFQQLNNKRQKQLMTYLEKVTGLSDMPAEGSLEQSPLPVLVFRAETGAILWSNQNFIDEVSSQCLSFHKKVQQILPNFDTRWILEGKSLCPQEQVVDGRRFYVYGNLARTKEKKANAYLATTYWVEITDLSQKAQELEETRPTVSFIRLDNYDDLIGNLNDSQSSTVLSAVYNKIAQWVEGSGGILRRFTRENYLLITERHTMDQYIQEKFTVLESVREVVSSKGVTATLSIGVGMGGENVAESMDFASVALDMALSRGGDQVATKEQEQFLFYGGRGTETEKRSKVKSRVTANSLASLIADSSRVFITGHKNPDMDAVGAAAGIFALARKKSIPAYIIRLGKDSPAELLYDKLIELPEYQEKFIAPQEAMLLLDSRSLFVVVDTNRPDQVLGEEILQSEHCKRIAVIDHHRRAASYIDNAVLNYHELYASSACELVTELLQYSMEPKEFLLQEAEALLAGIVLDTKNFSQRTGSNTFEAAAFLRRCGAEPVEVKKLFENNLDGAIARYKIVQSAQVYPQREDIAIAWTGDSVGRVVAAQAADELLNIRGITTSFVISASGEEAVISGRSVRGSGNINVQLVLEALGGGGNSESAGAQLKAVTPTMAVNVLKEALEKYLSENN